MIASSALPALQHIARNMSALDRQEIFATRHQQDPDAIAAEALHSHHSYVCRDITAFGALEIWPHVWSVWMFSTDAFHYRAGASILKHYRRVILPDVLQRGAHRVQCDSLAEHNVAHEFIQRFGGKPEFTMKGYGRNGESFIRFAWDRAALEAQCPKLHIPQEIGITAHV